VVVRHGSRFEPVEVEAGGTTPAWFMSPSTIRGADTSSPKPFASAAEDLVVATIRLVRFVAGGDELELQAEPTGAPRVVRADTVVTLL